ncbi:rhodanese-like domain-containing protein [Streptomyces sp. NPDC047928]|uniref:rhodanese-like domain-containing protein n=1 Tax=unclassified Streptomyces TaxID=2593676 RepID=UPI003715F88E
MTITPRSLDTDQARSRLHELTVIDVRTPGEYAAGHLPGALNIPLDRLDRALPDIRRAAERRDILVVCASGARSGNACRLLADSGITTATLAGGTGAWAARGHDLHRPPGAPRTVWGMERQVRLTAGTLVLTGLALGLLHPAFLLLSAGIAGGLVFSALTDTCGMAAVLGRLPHNRPRPADLDATLAALRDGHGASGDASHSA